MTLLDMLPAIVRAAPRRLGPAIRPNTASCDEDGRRRRADVPLTTDETDSQGRARHYRNALRDVEVVYPGKSLLTTGVPGWVSEDGLGVDVCSPGELAVALAGGIDPARVIVHGNGTSSGELRDAVTAAVGRVVLYSSADIAYLAGLSRRRQRVLIEVTPDVDIHGHRAIITGLGDRQFGFTVDGGHVADAVTEVLAHPILDMIGLHCHLASEGSQAPDPALYREAIRRMIAVMADIRLHHGAILTELGIGGGDAVRARDPDGLAAAIEDALDEACGAEHFPRPALVV